VVGCPSKPKNQISSLAKLRRQYQTEAACRAFLEELRWPQGPFCPHCGSYAHWALSGDSCRPGLKECADCHRQYTVTTKTPLHATKLPLWTWIQAIYLVLTSSKGLSSVVMARLLGVTQATAWRMGHAIREMMHYRYDTEPALSGTIEIDVKYLGGAPKWRKDAKPAPRGKATKKQKILLAIQRGGEARAMVIPEESADDIMAALSPIVAPGSLLVSDKQNSFTAAAADMGLEIETVIHSKREYVRDDVHSGTVDGLGGTLERAKGGVYHRLSRGHLQRYLDEICFRWNCRKRFRELGRSRRWRWVIVLKPLVEQLRTLMRSSIGRRIRRTPNYGFEVVSNQLPRPI
jgi:transposase-like protein